MVNLSYKVTLRRHGDGAANSKNSGDDLHDDCEQLYTVEWWWCLTELPFIPANHSLLSMKEVGPESFGLQKHPLIYSNAFYAGSCALDRSLPTRPESRFTVKCFRLHLSQPMLNVAILLRRLRRCKGISRVTISVRSVGIDQHLVKSVPLPLTHPLPPPSPWAIRDQIRCLTRCGWVGSCKKFATSSPSLLKLRL